MQRTIKQHAMRKTAGRAGGYLALLVAALLISSLQGAPPPARPDLKSAKPLATCKLHDMGTKRQRPEMMADAVLYTPPKVLDPLVNYERTPLGDWRTANQLLVATLITRAARRRRESVGGHRRVDYPPKVRKPKAV